MGRSTTSGGPYSIIANVAGTGFTDTNLVNNKAYFYAVSAVDSASPGPYSAEVSAYPSVLGAWFVADSIAGLANGASVSNWPDLSGHGNNATQSSTVNQPAYITKAMNGHSVVRFNSANNTFLGFNRPAQDDFTILVAYQSRQTNQGSGAAFYYGAGLINGDQPFVQNDYGTQINSLGQLTAGTGNPDVSISSGPGFNDGQPHLMTFERTESTGQLALYVDGNLAATGAGGTASLTAPATLDFGAVPSGGGFFTGDIAEALIYNAALSGAARQSKETYLRVKYMNLAPPALATSVAGAGDLTFVWPAVPGFNLYTATNLAPPVAWTPVTNLPTAANGTNTLVLRRSAASSFFELIDQ